MPFLGFTDETIKRYTSYCLNRKFIISMENANSDKVSIMWYTTRFNFGSTALFNFYQRYATSCR